MLMRKYEKINKMKNKKGQVWVETVIYILIGLGLIALIMAFAMPKINEQKERAIVEQTVNSLLVLDGKMNEVIDAGKDNRRIIEFRMRAGELYIDGPKDSIIFMLGEMTKAYSEPGVKVPLGRIILETTKGKRENSVNLTLQYGSSANITFNNEEKIKKLFSATLPYKIAMENTGPGKNVYNVSISLVS